MCNMGLFGTQCFTRGPFRTLPLDLLACSVLRVAPIVPYIWTFSARSVSRVAPFVPDIWTF